MDKARRRATLVAFASQAETMASDDALDIFDAFMTDIASRAKAEGEKKRLVTLQALDIAAMRLVQACGPLLDETVPDVKARQAAFRFMGTSKNDVVGVKLDVSRGLPDRGQA